MSQLPDVPKLHEDKDVNGLINALKFSRGRKGNSSAWGFDALNVTHFAAMALGDMGDTRALKPLMEILEDNNEFKELRKYAAFALGEIGDARAIDLLKHTEKNSKDNTVSNAATYALSEIGDPQNARIMDKPSMTIFGRPNIQYLRKKGDVKRLIKSLGYTKYGRWFREAVVDALIEIDDVRAVEPMVRIIKDKGENKKLRVTIANELAKLKDPMLIRNLYTILTDESEYKELRALSAKVLGDLADDNAIDGLTDIVEKWQVLNEIHSGTRILDFAEYLDCILWKNAFDALIKITKKNLEKEYEEALTQYHGLQKRFSTNYGETRWAREKSSYGLVHFGIP